jgi:hypothetical protein
LTEPGNSGDDRVSLPVGLGRSHGTSRALPFDRWFRYPAGFASDHVSMLFERLQLSSGTVLDCFTGSGVTGSAAVNAGLRFQGIEAHPLIAELASLKLERFDGPAGLAAKASIVVQRAETASRPLLRPESGFEDLEPDLVRRSFDRETLARLVCLRDQVKIQPDGHATKVLKWALLATVREVANVKVGWPYQRPALSRRAAFRDPFARFLQRVSWMSDDIDSARPVVAGSRVVVGDSRDPAAWHDLIGDACISSPPYLNNFDYADATRLELYFWGEVTSWLEMTSTVRVQMLTATTQQSSRREQRVSEEELAAQLGSGVNEVRELQALLSEQRRERGPGGKQYDQVLPAYLASMLDVLRNLAGHLRSGGTAIWLVGDSAPYGVYVDTPALIARLAHTVGFELLEDVAVRARGKRWASAVRHPHPLTERMIVMRLS